MSKVNVVSAEVSPRLRLQLVASEPIFSGEIIVQSDDEEIQFERTWRTLQVDDARQLPNDFLYFVDHSCSPNALLDADKLDLMAIRDISVGDPITFFYPGSEVELSQSGNDPSQVGRRTTFSKVWAAVDGSVFDARKGLIWLKFRCKSTIEGLQTCASDHALVLVRGLRPF